MPDVKYEYLAENPVYGTWVDQVHALGGVATKWPYQGPIFGTPAARYPAQAGLPIASYRYELAPLSVLRAWVDELASEAETLRRAGAIDAIMSGVATVSDATKKVVAGAADLPRQALGAVTGIPPWLITVGIGVGIVVAFHTLLPSLPRIVEHHAGLKNPPRRRRRRASGGRR